MNQNIKNFILEGEKEFEERFLVNVKNKLGWKLPRIAYVWEESGKEEVEWEDMEKELKQFISSRQISLIKMIVEEINQYKSYYNPIGDKLNQGRMLACNDIINSLTKE